MYQKKLLILLFKACFSLIIIFMLQGCANIAANKQLTNMVYISPLQEQSGMLIRNNLLPYFSNQDITTATFIVDIKLNTINTLYLTNKYGYATKGKTTLTSTLTITNQQTKAVLLQVSSQFIESFNIEPTGYAARKTKELAQQTTAEQASQDIKIKIYSFLQRYRNNPNNIKPNYEAPAQTNP